ncbi:MAG: heterodisulfide reductase subunit C [Acidobacteria bacterium]|nr:MAG: heterodisulfide reductase subunit C [Acidobacteriota bacterium]
MSVQTARVRDSLAEEVYRSTGQSVARCYQCGKCSAGCPLASETDYPPSQLLRLTQFGDASLDQKALGSLTIWLCLTCQTCSARCPQEVDLPRIMDFLRQKSWKQGTVHPKARNIIAFHRSFLGSIRMTGRMFELGMIADYKRRSWKFFQDVLLAPKLFVRGKLHFLPHRIHGARAVRRIFSRALEKRGATR